MKSLERILETLRRHREEIMQRFHIVKIGIYGSFVKGEENEKSDINIYVEFDLDKLTFEKYLEFIEYLDIKKEIKESIVYV